MGILCLCQERGALNFDKAKVLSAIFKPEVVVCQSQSLEACDYHIIDTWATDGGHKGIVCLSQASDENC